MHETIFITHKTPLFKMNLVTLLSKLILLQFHVTQTIFDEIFKHRQYFFVIHII